jgi:hypothetical protein
MCISAAVASGFPGTRPPNHRCGYPSGHRQLVPRGGQAGSGGTEEPLASRLVDIGVNRTKAVESLVIVSFVRGLSVREAVLAEALGEHAALCTSPGTCSRR